MDLKDQVEVHPRDEPKLAVSFYKHLVVPRKILMAVDSRYKLISNYIDLAFEIGLNPQRFTSSAPPNSNSHSQNIPVDMRFGASWQLNKNNLVKFKVDQDSVS